MKAEPSLLIPRQHVATLEFQIVERFPPNILI